MRVHAHCADGFDGWADDAPFDRIVINAATPEIPPLLRAQLKPGGTLVGNVGGRLVSLRNDTVTDLGPLNLQPLERGVADDGDSAG